MPSVSQVRRFWEVASAASSRVCRAPEYWPQASRYRLLSQTSLGHHPILTEYRELRWMREHDCTCRQASYPAVVIQVRSRVC